MDNNIIYTIPAKLENIRNIRQQLTKQLQSTQLSAERQQHLLLAISEWMTNLIRHPKQKPKYISLSIKPISSELQQNKLEVTIEDDGEPFIQIEKYFYSASHKKDDEISDHGYGLFLINKLFPQHIYIPKTQQNKKRNYFKIIVSPKVTTKPTIAIIESDSKLATLLKNYLNADYEVLYFENNNEFLLKINELKLNLIISEISQTNNNGLELRKTLTENSKTDLIPFIFVSKDNSSELELQASQLNIDDYLKLPIAQTHFLAVIKRVLTRGYDNQQNMGMLFDVDITACLHPELPNQIQGFSCHILNRNANTGGGDLIVHLPGENRDIVILADVMGHDINAKFYAHTYAGYLQGVLHSLHQHRYPNKLLEAFSNHIAKDSYLDSIIITCLVISLESNGMIQIANAGHPKPILMSNQGIEYIDITGSLPGINTQLNYHQHAIDISHRRLLLYTDGLFEHHTNHDNLESTISQILKDSQSYSLEKTATNIIQNYDKFTENNSHRDDATLILIERRFSRHNFNHTVY